MGEADLRLGRVLLVYNEEWLCIVSDVCYVVKVAGNGLLNSVCSLDELVKGEDTISERMYTEGKVLIVHAKSPKHYDHTTLFGSLSSMILGSQNLNNHSMGRHR